MRIVIIGQKWLAEQLLQQCLNDGHDVVAVFAPSPNDRLFQAACEHRVSAFDLLPPAEMMPESDVILAAHAHVFISQAHRETAKLGAIGYHPSLLPRHRGRDAVRWVVHMGEKITGGTLYQMDDGADTGAILLQDWCHIRPDDTAQTLWQRELAPLGLRLFQQYLRDWQSIQPKAQDETLATFEPAFTLKKLSG
ncbi:formyltransferase family protein [Wielerella bovis]|uniref:formyltransferase family protein n=1 Tax=Wielerella bovis TaxID=2917790 RepID=UPI0020185D08|nr:formyltransferase family protein [Wielerella bovis]ULJ60782.1 methionyl-tRNA formyltransferase [Wielerella bovis]